MKSVTHLLDEYSTLSDSEVIAIIGTFHTLSVIRLSAQPTDPPKKQRVTDTSPEGPASREAPGSGQVAQVVERSPEKAGVGGSTPSLATIFSMS